MADEPQSKVDNLAQLPVKIEKSREFGVRHPDGRISDAELHEPILRLATTGQVEK